MIEIRLGADTTQLEALQRSFALAPDIVLDELRQFFTGGALHLQGEVQNLTPTSKGLLRNSISSETRVEGIGVQSIVGSSLAYAAPVEVGTKPHMPPLEPLIDWVKQKLPVGQAYSAGTRRRMGDKADRAEPDAAAKAVARKIQWKIAHYGTPAVGMFHRAWAVNRSQFEEKFAETVHRIVARVAEAH